MGLLLQRRLPAGDRARWRTVLRIQHAWDADELVALARRIDPEVQWRLAEPAPRGQ